MSNYFCIVPVFKRVTLTKKFISSIADAVLLHNVNIEIVIVDDDPTLSSLKFIDEFKLLSGELINLTVISTSGDTWWCETVNAGLRYISDKVKDPDYVIIANNDVEVSSNIFQELEKKIKEDPSRAYHPLTLNRFNGEYHSSGAKVITWFPYVTKHAKKLIENNTMDVDLATARFLTIPYSKMKLVDGISRNLVQYQGDNDLSLKLKAVGCKTTVFPSAKCYLFDNDTGLKNENISSMKVLLSSLFSVRSANNLKYRYKFVSNHFSRLFSIFVVLSMTINTILKFFFNIVCKYEK
ncbi:TPA: glycosyltransferase family 2 protein [Vibrio vulnificus]